MKISKREGLEILHMLDIPSVKLIDPNLLDENSSVLKEGLSVRLSPKENRNNNVYLPSIHNQTNLIEIREFIRKYQRQYNIIVHKTVRPEIIGSVSKYQLSPEDEKLVIELFENFQDRTDGRVDNRAILPILGGRIMICRIKNGYYK